jgi:3-phenylpropionate/cinnamic acid dioxygenase small subunit
MQQAEIIRQFADRTDVLDVVVAYATALDTRDWTALGILFTEDASWEYAGTDRRFVGPTEIVDFIRAGLDGIDVTQHLNGNHAVTLRGDEAEHTCYFHAQHVRLGTPGGDTFLGAGRYRDRLRRTPDGWRFTDRVLTSMWRTGNPAVLTLDR